ncbi:MAG: hypothetical protein ACRCXD_00630 [Luteolibacter sp.]
MNTRRFVSGSSILLAGWLGATFLNEVPSQRYPKLDKTPPTAAIPISEEKVMLAAVSDVR